MTHNQPIPSELSEYTLSCDSSLKLLLIDIHNYTKDYPDRLSSESYHYVEDLLTQYFNKHLLFKTQKNTCEIISILFILFPDHFKILKHSIYHTALVHTYALHKTLINNSQNRHKATNQLSKEEVAKQLKLRHHTSLAAEENNFSFDPNYIAHPQPDCGLDISQPISIEKLSLLTKKLQTPRKVSKFSRDESIPRSPLSTSDRVELKRTSPYKERFQNTQSTSSLLTNFSHLSNHHEDKLS